LIKTDSDGDTLWTKNYGGANDDRFVSIQQTADGGYVAVGFTESFGVDSIDIYIVKTDSIGNMLWTKTIGGSNDDIGRSIDLLSENEYIVAGHTASQGVGGFDFYLLRLGCIYVVGDINNSGGLNGLDITFGVSYFKGGAEPPYMCDCSSRGIWFVGGDVNGSCSYNGLDITYGVSYFKGGPAPIPCADCPPNNGLAINPKR